jgi:hypothetical protein
MRKTRKWTVSPSWEAGNIGIDLVTALPALERLLRVRSSSGVSQSI